MDITGGFQSRTISESNSYNSFRNISSTMLGGINPSRFFEERSLRKKEKGKMKNPTGIKVMKKGIP